MKKKREGIDNDGIKEIYYWCVLDNKIIGSSSVRLNADEDDFFKKYYGHIFYQVVPSKRRQGFGTELCHLTIEKMNELGFDEAIITCSDTNIGSQKIIKNNGGESFEILQGDGFGNTDVKTRMYTIDIKESLKNYNNLLKNKQKIH